MPNGLLPDVGLGDQLAYILREPIAGVLPWQLVLWVNDVVPTAATVWADLVEASFTGYIRYTLARGGWSIPNVANGCARATWGTSPVTWTVGPGLTPTVRGWAMIEPTTNVLRFVQRFDAADIRAAPPGSLIALLPTYTLTSAACSGG